jgi:hypothetical protein
MRQSGREMETDGRTSEKIEGERQSERYREREREREFSSSHIPRMEDTDLPRQKKDPPYSVFILIH